MKAKTLILVFFFLALTKLSVAQSDCEPCKQILENGIISSYNLDKAIDVKKQFVTYLKSPEFFIHAFHQYQSSSFGFSAVVDGLPVGMTFDQIFLQDPNSTFKKFLEQFQSETYSFNEMENVYAQFVEPSVVTAWKECIKNCPQSDIKISYQATNEKEIHFTLDSKINPLKGSYVIQDFSIKGGSIAPKCSTLIKDGKKITGKFEFDLLRDSLSVPLNFVININSENQIKNLNVLLPASFKKYTNVIVFRGDSIISKDVLISNAYLVVFYQSRLSFLGNNADNSALKFEVSAKNLVFIDPLTISGKATKGVTGVKGAPCTNCNGTRNICEGNCASAILRSDKVNWKGGTGGTGGIGYPGASVKINTDNLVGTYSINGGAKSLAGGDGGDGGDGGEGMRCYNDGSCYTIMQWELTGNKGPQGQLGANGEFVLTYKNPKGETITVKQ